MPPRDARYLEDYLAGATYSFGSVSVSLDEIICFAAQFDPQPIHIDPDHADKGPFGGVIASGWHTAALMMRLYTDHFLTSVASLASPGVDELRWLNPVRPGDTLSIRIHILEARRSKSKPNQGVVRSRVELVNQLGWVVLSVVPVSLVGCRPA
jgi:acyl dehydratase